jgi:hypothetical protein
VPGCCWAHRSAFRGSHTHHDRSKTSNASGSHTVTPAARSTPSRLLSLRRSSAARSTLRLLYATPSVGEARSRPRAGPCLLLLLLGALAFPSPASATSTITSVTFVGNPADPQVTIAGQGFGSEPPATNQAYPGYTGYDYGNALYFCDTSPDPNSFCAGQNDGGGSGDTVGLVVRNYNDTQVSYTLGSTYSQSYYPSDVFALHQGDTFAVYTDGTVCGGEVIFGRTVHCQASSAAPRSVVFSGSPADPQVTIAGQGFGSEPTATNLAYPGYTGYDYGNALYFCDTSRDPNAFCAGQNDGSGGWDAIGLVVGTYAPTRIAYSLGSAYAQYYYPSHIYELEQGDAFAVTVKGRVCTGVVDFGGTPVHCHSALSPTPPSSIVSKLLPRASGVAIQGRLMTVKHGTWAGSPTRFRDQWERCDVVGAHCLALPGAVGATYRLTAGDVAHTIRVQETASNARGTRAAALSPPGTPVLPALLPNPQVRRQVAHAAARLLRRPAVDVRLSVRLTGALAQAFAPTPTTILRGTGRVAFRQHRARWSLALPRTLGGGTLQVITIGSATYVQLGRITSGAGREWVSVTSAALPEVSRLGFVGSLAMLLNPAGTLGLLRSAPSDVSQLKSPVSRGASAPNGQDCNSVSRIKSVEAGLNPNRLTDRRTGLTTGEARSYRRILSSLTTPRMIAQIGAGGALAEVQLIDPSGLTVTTDYCNTSRSRQVTAPQGRRVSRLRSLTALDSCLVGRWQLVGAANRKAELTISPTGAAKLLYRARASVAAGDYGLRGGQNGIGVFGSAKLTILSSRDPGLHYLVWATSTNDVHQIFAGNYSAGGPGRLPAVNQPEVVPVRVNGIIRTAYRCTNGGSLTLAPPVGTRRTLGFTPYTWHRG